MKSTIWKPTETFNWLRVYSRKTTGTVDFLKYQNSKSEWVTTVTCTSFNFQIAKISVLVTKFPQSSHLGIYYFPSWYYGKKIIPPVWRPFSVWFADSGCIVFDKNFIRSKLFPPDTENAIFTTQLNTFCSKSEQSKNNFRKTFKNPMSFCINIRQFWQRSYFSPFVCQFHVNFLTQATTRFSLSRTFWYL